MESAPDEACNRARRACAQAVEAIEVAVHRTILFVLFSILATVLLGVVLLPGIAGRTHCCFLPPSVGVYRNGEQLVAASGTDGLGDPGKWELVASARLFTRPVKTGLIAARTTNRPFRLSFDVVADDPPPEETMRSVCAQAFAGMAYGQFPGFDAERLGSGDYVVSEQSVMGYVVDACAYAGVLGIGAGWLVMLGRCVRRDRYDRRASDGRVCPSCAYDLTGLRNGPCPECGHVSLASPAAADATAAAG